MAGGYVPSGGIDGPIVGDLVVTGNVEAERFLGGDGSLASPTFSFQNDGDSGDFLEDPDQVSTTVGGLRHLRVRTSQINILNAMLEATNSIVFSGSLTPASISGTVNNYAPVGIGDIHLISQSLSADATLTGLGLVDDGRKILIRNDSSFKLTLAHEGVTSLAANRFSCPNNSDVVLLPNEMASLHYLDKTIDRWLVVSPTALVTAAPSQGIGGGNSEGSATTLARSDHDHALRTSVGVELTLDSIADGAALMRTGNVIEGTMTVAPGGSAGGDLDGTYPNPTVVAITETTQRLGIAGIDDGQLLSRIGTNIRGVPLSAVALYWTANNAIFPDPEPNATSRNKHALISFDDTNPERIILEGVMPLAYNGANLDVCLHWVAASSTTGVVRWGGRFENNTTDIDADSFAAQQVIDASPDAILGVPVLTFVSFTQAQADGIFGSGSFRLEIERIANADTMVGDAQLLRVALVDP